MPVIKFTADLDTGETDLTIDGIPGKGCVLIHDAVSADLRKVLGLAEVSVKATPDFTKPVKTTLVRTSTVRR